MATSTWSTALTGPKCLDRFSIEMKASGNWRHAAASQPLREEYHDEGHHQDDGPQRHDAGQFLRETKLTPNVDRQGRIGAGQEERHDEFVEGNREGEEQAGENPGEHNGEGHPPEGPPGIVAQIRGRLFHRPVKALETGHQGRHGEGHADKYVAERDRVERQRYAEPADQDQQGHAHDDAGDHQRQHDREHDRLASGHPIAAHGLGAEDAQDGGNHGGRPADLDAVHQGRVHRLVGEHLLVPLGGKGLERKGDVDGIVEGEHRQEQHRHVEKGEKRDRIGAQKSARLLVKGRRLHAMRSVILRVIPM
jgi:hypothetical protein